MDPSLSPQLHSEISSLWISVAIYPVWDGMDTGSWEDVSQGWCSPIVSRGTSCLPPIPSSQPVACRGTVQEADGMPWFGNVSLQHDLVPWHF